MQKNTLYDIFFEFGLQIPSCYVQDQLWTKLAPDITFLSMNILNRGQLDKMQQLLSPQKIESFTAACMNDFF